MYSSQMDTAPPVARALVRIINLLRSDGLDKSVKEHLIKVMRENPNLDKKEIVMTLCMPWRVTKLPKLLPKRRTRLTLSLRPSIVRCVLKNIKNVNARINVVIVI